MAKLKVLLWLATLLPYQWWQRAWWRWYFMKRILFLEPERTEMKNIDHLIVVYVPETETMCFEDAARLAVERDENAADEFKASAESQLLLERAAAVSHYLAG